MKANEIEDGKVLMIGDLVIGCIETDIVGEATYKIPCKVTDINHYGDVKCEALEPFPDELDWQEEDDFSWIEAIPLTAEILKQNGFGEKIESNPFVYYLFKDSDNSVSLEHTYDTTDKEDYWACSIGNRLCDVCNISMHYIHELQHALKLCGIDKEIVL